MCLCTLWVSGQPVGTSGQGPAAQPIPLPHQEQGTEDTGEAPALTPGTSLLDGDRTRPGQDVGLQQGRAVGSCSLALLQPCWSWGWWPWANVGSWVWEWAGRGRAGGALRVLCSSVHSFTAEKFSSICVKTLWRWQKSLSSSLREEGPASPKSLRPGSDHCGGSSPCYPCCDL